MEIEALPPQADVEERLAVMLLHCSRPLQTRFAYAWLADEFRLSALQLQRQRQDGENEWRNLVRFAYRRLKEQDYAPRPPPEGEWSLTDTGREYAVKIERRPFLTAEELGI